MKYNNHIKDIKFLKQKIYLYIYIYTIIYIYILNANTKKH